MLARKQTKKEGKKLLEKSNSQKASQSSFIKAESALKMNHKTDSEISMNFDSQVVDVENQLIRPQRSSEKRVKPLIEPIPEMASNETMETPFEPKEDPVVLLVGNHEPD